MAPDSKAQPPAPRGPTLHDHITRLGLYLSKAGGVRLGADDRAFYRAFFTEKHVDESRYDLRHRLRHQSIARALAELSCDGPGDTLAKAPGSGRAENGCARRPVVVDIGLGVGDIIEIVPRRCLRVGLAYSTGDLKMARVLGLREVAFVKASALALPFCSGTLDVVLCLEVMEHLENDRNALAELSRVLKPGGVVIISVPGNYYFHDYLDLIGHHRHYTRRELIDLLAEVDISVVEYLDQYHGVVMLHYYPYMLLAVMDRLLNRCGMRARSLYVRPVLGRIYAGIRALLAAVQRDRSQEQLASDSRSTFVLARKRPAPSGPQEP